MKIIRSTLFVMLGLSMLLTACGPSDEAAANSIEHYIESVVSQDMDAAINASCADWEADARTEVISFDGVSAHLEGMSCSVISTDGDTNLVSCAGEIIATYAGEDTPLPLTDYVYTVVNEGGEWRMCGYK